VLPARIKQRRLEAGCDEVGRGCLAGPVVAAAVILPPRFRHPDLNDSKKLSEKKRLMMTELIKKKAVAWFIAEVSPQEIDQINILNASFLAMNKAVKGLSVCPDHLLIDGNRFKTDIDISFDCIVKGDSIIGSIAAASILAKTYRDKLMTDLGNDFQMYDWHKNVGYPTRAHRDGIIRFGSTIHHRKSFQLLPAQLELDSV
jgi:ribonuclease HII